MTERHRQKKKQKDNETLLEKMIFDMIKKGSGIIIRAAVDEVIDEFNKGINQG